MQFDKIQISVVLGGLGLTIHCRTAIRQLSSKVNAREKSKPAPSTGDLIMGDTERATRIGRFFHRRFLLLGQFSSLNSDRRKTFVTFLITEEI